jgi:1,2-dihydroxy-3-keto-5-methylthiopentene dioxygenase
LTFPFGLNKFKFDPSTLNENPEFLKFKADNGYTYEDQVFVSPDRMGAEYKNKVWFVIIFIHSNFAILICFFIIKLSIFFTEHLHTDDEVRFVMDGSGFFDVRDEDDNWVRLWTRKGDLIVLPKGIYHRFTTDENHYIHALRLFVGDPIWTPLNRPCDNIPSRLDYIKKFYKNNVI